MANIYRLEYGSPYIRRRTENGWTADFVFNREGQGWDQGSVFYFWGISGETIDYNYADNSLSFQFTPDGRICWKTIKYQPVGTITGYTSLYTVLSGITSNELCTNGTSNDFNITVTFKRYKTLTDCSLENEGGINDLISGLTLNTGSVDIPNWITGDTAQYTSTEVLGTKWYNERKSRLGTLKIYLNGNPIYKLENFEEIIPSERQSQNPLVQAWGIGTNGIQEIHQGTCQFNLKNIEYYEEPLDAISVKNHYITKIKTNFSITECNEPCLELPSIYQPNALMYEDGNYIITEDRTIITL